MKKIIFNKTLRDIRRRLKQAKVEFPDYALNKKILKSIRSVEEGVQIIRSLSQCKLTPEKYDFMLELYQNDKNAYEKFQIGILDNCDIDEVKDIYSKHTKLFGVLLSYPWLLKKEVVDFYGDELLLANASYLDMLFDIPISEVKPYIDRLKANPKNFSVFFEVMRQIGIHPELKIILDHVDNENLPSVYTLFKMIQDNALKRFLIDNMDNLEVIEFCKKIINNSDGKLSVSLFDYKEFIDYLKKISPHVDDFILKQFVICKLRDFSDISAVKLIMLKALLKQEHALDLQASILAVDSDDVIVQKIKKKILEATRLLDEKLSKEELFNNFTEHYLTGDLNIDYCEAYNCIRNFNSALLKKNLTRIDNLKEVRSFQCSGLDKDGNEVTKNIPVKVIDDPNFHVLVHGIGYKDKSVVSNYEIANNLVDNPSLWVNNPEGGNPQISASLFNGYLQPFTSEVMLGFSQFSDERLIATYRSDAGTKMKRSQKEILSENKLFCFASYNELEKPYDYNEILLQRYKNGKTLLPDYILLQSDQLDDIHLNRAKNWAAFYDVPIVIIDKVKIGEFRKNNVTNLINKMIAINQVTREDIKELQGEIKIVNWCFRYDKQNYIDPYTVIQALQNRINLTSSTAEVMLELMKDYGFVFYEPKVDETLLDVKASHEYAFLPPRFYSGVLTDEDRKLAVQRQQITSEYISRCKEIIFAQSQTFEHSTIKK